MSKWNEKSELLNKEREIYEVAIRFSRMWGVMETLEPIPNHSVEEVRDIVMTWAEEYVVSGQDDWVKFFHGKRQTIL